MRKKSIHPLSEATSNARFRVPHFARKKNPSNSAALHNGVISSPARKMGFLRRRKPLCACASRNREKFSPPENLASTRSAVCKKAPRINPYIRQSQRFFPGARAKRERERERAWVHKKDTLGRLMGWNWISSARELPISILACVRACVCVYVCAMLHLP